MILIVAGTFDDNGGKPSGYVNKLFANCIDTKFINGGYWNDLNSIYQEIRKYSIIFWLADVPNDKPKLIDKLKLDHRECLLITSKNNFDEKYQPLHLVARALKHKSNLLLEFTKKDKLIACTIWDPLGNIYTLKETDTTVIALKLSWRLLQLQQAKRIKSISAKDQKTHITNDEAFFKISRDYAEKFHSIIHAANTERFVGNLSFRCDNGFPSYKDDSRIFVSKRNIDKRSICKENFVPVELAYFDPIWYHGDYLPSVDTPIQVRLYNTYPNINYMLHAHVYIKDAPFTSQLFSCGDVKEAIDICNIIKDTKTEFFTINLKGHGSLVAAKKCEMLKNIEYYPRPLPEIQL